MSLLLVVSLGKSRKERKMGIVKNIKDAIKLVQQADNIELLKKLWQREPDGKVILRAATEDLDEYPAGNSQT
jgi:hypothetical protein